MKKPRRFWASLEKYILVVMARSPLPWTWIGVGLVIIIILTSVLQMKNSVVGANNATDVIEKAVGLGDYKLAKILYQVLNNQNKVLGEKLEDKIYPEKVVEKKIAKLEASMVEYPEHRDAYLMLADLYKQLNEQEKANKYWERARTLDPNNEIFK